MTVFVVLMPSPQPELTSVIEELFPQDSLAITETQWLISSRSTAIELCARLGIVDPRNPDRQLGNAVVFATSSYYGRAPSSVWDWIRSKLEAPVHG